MRKKTIEEELKEIQEEKTEHIQNLQSEFLSSEDDHTYDFSFETQMRQEDSAKETEEESSTDPRLELENKIKKQLQEFRSSIEQTKKQVEQVQHLQNANQTKTRNRRQSHRGVNIVAIFFIMIGLCISVFAGIVPWVKTASYVETKATVTDVHYYYDDDGDYMGRISYKYSFNGNEYEKRASYSQSASLCPSIGETITIYVNPKNPEDVRDNTLINIIFTFVGLIFAGAGTLFLIFTIKKNKKQTVDKNNKLI